MGKSSQRAENGSAITSSVDSYLCPVCGKYTFEDAGGYDICPICGWEDDPVQYDYPDEDNCSNKMSLNDARKIWASGRKIWTREDGYAKI